jgi:hypothetical protein
VAGKKKQKLKEEGIITGQFLSGTEENLLIQ